jgi:hypothetical protein
VILYRHEGELFCRTEETFEIDGLRHHRRGRIHRNARVVGEGFSFSLEAI